MKTTEDRLASLEHGMRRWKLVSAALAIGLVGVCVLAAGPEAVPDVLRCHKLEVVDKDDATIASISEGPRGGVLSLGNNKGQTFLRAADPTLTISSTSKVTNAVGTVMARNAIELSAHRNEASIDVVNGKNEVRASVDTGAHLKVGRWESPEQ